MKQASAHAAAEPGITVNTTYKPLLVSLARYLNAIVEAVFCASRGQAHGLSEATR